MITQITNILQSLKRDFPNMQISFDLTKTGLNITFFVMGRNQSYVYSQTIFYDELVNIRNEEIMLDYILEYSRNSLKKSYAEGEKRCSNMKK